LNKAYLRSRADPLLPESVSLRRILSTRTLRAVAPLDPDLRHPLRAATLFIAVFSEGMRTIRGAESWPLRLAIWTSVIISAPRRCSSRFFGGDDARHWAREAASNDPHDRVLLAPGSDATPLPGIRPTDRLAILAAVHGHGS